MRSIRLSLLVYFLGLLVVALGVASLLVYRSAERTLADKEEAMRKGIQVKYEERCREERKRLDDALLEQALALAGRLQLQVHWSRLNRIENLDPDPDSKSARSISNSVYSLGVITAAFAPCGYLNVAPWALQWNHVDWHIDKRRGGPPGPRPQYAMLSPVTFEIWRRLGADVSLNMSPIELTTSPIEVPGGIRPGDYFQIDVNNWGKPVHSKSLQGRTFPDVEGFGGDKGFLHKEWDDFELSPGHWVRRVRVKASRLRFVPAPGRRGRGGPPPLSTPMPPPPAEAVGGDSARHSPTRDSSLFVVLQVAADRNKLTNALHRFAAQREEELETTKAETAQSLTQLRTRLLTICSVTFAATILGAWWLVRLGLVPLRRMSDAVSKVSPRDFRLHLGNAPLPKELRPIAERLGCTLELLKRAFAREKQSTADISHELRTPLAAMMATTELALRKQRTAEQYREFLQDCRCSAQHMNQIVERLLTLARLDAGVDRLRPQAVDVGELAEQCAAVVRPLAEAQGLRLSVSNDCSASQDEGDRPTRLTTDPDKLREVVNNLLHNAIQYNRPEGRIELTVARGNGHVCVEVRDTGIGIAPEAKDHIFERFYRADPARNGDGMHAGLGLALVKEYVDLMGGRIAVDSAPGQGSTFKVELPLVQPTVAV